MLGVTRSGAAQRAQCSGGARAATGVAELAHDIVLQLLRHLKPRAVVVAGLGACIRELRGVVEAARRLALHHHHERRLVDGGAAAVRRGDRAANVGASACRAG